MTDAATRKPAPAFRPSQSSTRHHRAASNFRKMERRRPDPARAKVPGLISSGHAQLRVGGGKEEEDD
jgi:hypothetical protein